MGRIFSRAFSIIYPYLTFVSQEENDDNYEEEPEVVDEFDSDFDEDVGTLYFYCIVLNKS